jgi:hypothetical protein
MATLRQMNRLVADSSISSADRQRQYADQAAHLDSTVHALNAIDLTSPLAKEVIGGLVNRTETTGQRVALEQVQRSVELFGEDLHNKAKDMRRGSDLPEVPVFVPISAGTAVVDYANEVPMGWVMAIGLDFIPLGLLFLWVTVCRDNRVVVHPRSPYGIQYETVYAGPPARALTTEKPLRDDGYRPNGKLPPPDANDQPQWHA